MSIPVSRFLQDQRVLRHPQNPQSPLVSVCMPTYRLRSGGTNQRAIESVLEQSFTDFEFIIVDDGSLDGLYDLLLQYQKRDSRIIIVRHEINSGLPGLRVNEAILLAKGKYIAYMFEDDEWYPNALEDLVTTAQSGPEECAIYGTIDWIIHQSDGKVQNRMLGNWDFNYGLLKNQNYMANCAILHSRSVFEKCGLYDPHVLLRRYCDYDLWLRMARKVPFIRCDSVIGKAVSATAYTLGSNVDQDLVVTRRLLNLERDEELKPQNFHTYQVDSLEFLHLPEEEHRIREHYILPYWQQHPMILSESEQKGILVSKRRSNRLLVTKEDYSTSVDVTLGNFSRLFSNAELSFAFFQERSLAGLSRWNYDTLVLYRTIGQVSWQALQQAHEWGKPSVYIMDDNMFKFGTGYLADEFGYLKPDSPAYRLLSQEVADVDLVISYSPVITEDCRQHNPRVVELSTNIMERHILDAQPPDGGKDTGRRLKYAILTGSARKEELRFLWGSLHEFSKKHVHDIEFHIWGIDPADFGELDCPVHHKPFTHSYDMYIESIKSERFDFVLCPLFDDHDAKLSKSPIKYFEATAAGAVGIYSENLVYRTVQDQHTGFKAMNSSETWLDVLEHTLSIDDTARRRLHANAKADVLRRFTSEAQVLEHLSAFEAANLHQALSSSSTENGRATIAYFFHEGLLGGATLHLMQHALILKQYGFSPILCFMKNAKMDTEVFKFAEKHGLPIDFLEYTCYVFAKKVTESDFQKVPMLKKWLLTKKIEFVHFATYMPATAIAAYELGIPSVATLHQFYQAPPSVAFISNGEEHFVSAIHSSSLRYADAWQKTLGAPAFCIRAPIPDFYFEEYQTRSVRKISSVPSLLISGTIQPRKGQLNAIKAIANLKKRGIEVKLLLLGYDDLLPDYVNECRNAIKEFNLEKQVSIAGFSAFPKAYYDDADFLLCSSDDESMPQSILKGIASGIRIITTPVGGVKELVVDGFSGIVSLGYKVEDLEEAILRAIRTPETHWGVMLNNAHLAARMSCSREVVANKLLGLYNLAVEENTRLTKRQAQLQYVSMISLKGHIILFLRNVKMKIIGVLKSTRLLKNIVNRFRNRSLHTEISPDFKGFLEDSHAFQNLDGFALQPSHDLQDVQYASYNIKFNRPSLSGISLAPIIEATLNQGVFGIEIVSPENNIVRQAVVQASEIHTDIPVNITFEPLSDTEKGEWEIRVFVRNMEGQFRLFEWRKYSLHGLGKLETRIFASFGFDSPKMPAA
jgi:O-antigen biosynthesis protein